MQTANNFITVDNFAVNFLLSNTNAFLGKAEEIYFNSVKKQSERILIFCYDADYFLLGKRVKDLLIKNAKSVTCYSLERSVPLKPSIEKIFANEVGFNAVLAVGNEKIAAAVAPFVNESKNFAFMPTDFDFSFFLCSGSGKNCSLIFDSAIFSLAKKNKVLSGLKSVVSKRIIFIEMRVNQLIGGYLEQKEAISAFEKGQEMLNLFLKDLNVMHLILAQFYCGVAISVISCCFEPMQCSIVAEKLLDNSGFGEREFLFYEILLKIYMLYFNNPIDFICKLPNVISDREQLERLGLLGCENYFEPLYDTKRLSLIKGEIKGDSELKQEVEKQLETIFSLKKIFKSVYAGRKYTVEHYSQKQRSTALKLAPLTCNKPSALKLVWADGVLEYIN